MVTILSSFLFSGFGLRSNGDRECIRAVVRGGQCLLDQSQPNFRIKGAPRPGGGVSCLDLQRLRGRAVFDEHTTAEAISHGAPPFLLLAAGGGGWIGEGIFLAGGWKCK